MCVTKSNNNYKTSYQRAHYYEGAAEYPQIIHCRAKVRPDLYYYDPVINEKDSTYRSSFRNERLSDETWNTCGRLDLSSKHTVKHLYDEYCKRPVHAVESYSTITGSNYADPRKSAEAKLLQKFCTEGLSDGIKNFSNDSELCEFLQPYVSTSHSAYKDVTESRSNGIAKKDIITYYNSRNRYKVSSNPRTYRVTPRVFIKIPFGGETSNYQENFQDPSKKLELLRGVEVCEISDYFQSVHKEPPQTPSMYFTEQMLTGSGKPTRATI